MKKPLGAKIKLKDFPEYCHPKHLQTLGFEVSEIALKMGQKKNYRMSLQNKRCLHIHLMPDDSLEVHIDRYDPQKYPVMHFLVDTWYFSVPIVLIGGVLAVLGLSIKRK